MTIVAGLVDVGRVWLGTDELVLYGDGTKAFQGDWKSRRHFGCRIAMSGDAAAQRAYSSAIYRAMADMPDGHPPHELCVHRYASYVRQALIEELGWPPRHEGGDPPFWDCSAMITDGRTLWTIGAACNPIQTHRWDTLGSASAVGLGAGVALDEMGVKGDVLVRKIIEVCCHAHRACGGRAFVHEVTPSGLVKLVESEPG